MATPLRYPKDLAENHTDWVSFEFYKYKSAFAPTGNTGNAPTTAGFLASYNKIAYEKEKDLPTISLYMPEDISADYQGNWGGRDFSPLGAALLRSTGQSLNSQEKSGLQQFIDTSVGNINNMKGGLLPYMAAAGIKSAMNGLPGFGGGVTANDVLASTQGRILNPNTEVLYSGPQLRTFGLNYKLFPRNEEESNVIREICNAFKKASLPRANSGISDARNLIGVPNIVKVRFKHKTEDNKWVSQFKECALGGVSVNYTPDGAWSTYVSGAPTAVILGLQFSELKLLYAEEIDNKTNY